MVEKMLESYLGWFGDMCRKPVKAHVKKVDQMKNRHSPIVRDKGRIRETIGETIKRYLD